MDEAGTSRRQFLKLGLAAGGGLLLPWSAKAFHVAKANPLNTLAASGTALTNIMPYQTELAGGNMPAAGPNNYQLAVRQFTQQILPANQFPNTPTLVAGYGPANASAANEHFHYPALTLNATVGTPTLVSIANQQGTLPHVLANYIGNGVNPAGSPGATPIITHLHGGNSAEFADGHIDAWYTPDKTNHGNLYPTFASEAAGLTGVWPDATTVHYYGNGDLAGTLWFHDHTLDLTKFNVYAGMAGFYLLKGGSFDLPSSQLPSGDYEIPLAVQDRAFDSNGALIFGGDGFSGNVMVVNGNTTPFLRVEPRRYRFRILNGCNDNTLELTFGRIPVYQIGTDKGFLKNPVKVKELHLTNEERADVIADFTGMAGKIINVGNLGDGPSEVMQIRVDKPLQPGDTSRPVSQLVLPSEPATSPIGLNSRKVAVVKDRIGIVQPLMTPLLKPLGLRAPATETPTLNTQEVWEYWPDDNHPMHIHLVHFHVLNRQRFNPTTGALIGSPYGPSANELGPKDTVLVNPGEVTRVVTSPFNFAGQFVHHCHILQHEDDGMMRPLVVS